jgi:spermidine synthase
VALFLAAAGVLALEILLTRVFSVVTWYHFASMAIAVAMFGLSAGGLVPYLLRRGGAKHEGFCGVPPRLGMALAGASALFTITPYGVLLLFARYPLWAGRLLSLFHQPFYEPFRSAAAQVSPASDTLQVGALLLLFSLPFLGAGAVFALAFSEKGREGKTYLSVMGGSAAGVAAYLAGMRAGSGPAAFLFVAALFSLSAAAFACKPQIQPQNRDVPGTPPKVGHSCSPSLSLFCGSSRNVPVLGFLTAAALLVLLGCIEARYGFAEIRFARGRYEPGMLWTRWDAVSRVAVYPVSGEESTKAWGVSPRYAGPAPEQIGMVVDDTGYTALFGMGKSAESMAAFRGNVASAAYHVRMGAKALVIGPGGGKDILCALASGARSVTAVEVNPLVVRAADEAFGEFTGRPYRMPGVRAVVEEGRNFLAADRTRYDVLQMTQVFGRIPPSAGAFTMSEDHLHTVEAFREYLAHLSDDGILTITRFVHERRVWRILALARRAVSLSGTTDPSRHVVALRDRGIVNFMVRKTPWTTADLAAVRRFSETMGFSILFAPDLPAKGLPARILVGGADAMDRPFDFSAPTDDRPFYYYTLRPEAFLSAGVRRGGEFEDRAVTMLRGFLLSAGGLCAVFLVVPGLLLSRREPDASTFAAPVYMFLVGLAYVVWEIVMIKRLGLLFGTPVLSLAAGLFLILACSAAGGYLAGRPDSRYRGGRMLAAVVAGTAWLFLAGPALAAFAGAPLPARISVAAAYVLPPSLLMGRFFPIGLRRYAARGGGTTPFLFAANGAASVLGAALTQALTLNAGYGATTIAGGVLYVVCAGMLALRGGRGAAG